MAKNDQASPKQNHRVITMLDREQIDYLDSIGKDALFSTGLKLARSTVLSALINVARHLGIRGFHASSQQELEGKILEALRHPDGGPSQSESRTEK